MKPLLPFFLSLLLFPVQLLAQLSAEDEAFILSFMEENKVPGISVAIVEQGKIIYAKAFGVADQKTGEKLTPQTLFQAASISKPFTGLLYMRKAQQETLDLDVPINQYLEDWTLPGYKRDPEQVATARLLLAHQGGTNMSGFLGWRQTRKRVPDLDEVLRGKKVHLWERRIYTKYPLNTRFAYSGGGYSVLEKAICQRFDTTFQALMREEIFEPCGMQESFFSIRLTPEQEERISSGHRKNGKLIKGSYHVYPQQAAAGLWTTPSDLVRMLSAVQASLKGEQEKPFLAPEMTQQLPQRLPLESGSLGRYNLGFQLTTDGEDELLAFGHGGANWGFSCFMYGHISNGKAVAIMSNRNSLSLWPVLNRINAAIKFDQP